MSGHTPGPWTVDQHSYIRAADGSPIAHVRHCPCVTEDPGPEVLANARLIAAAPRLLEALEEALRYISLCEEDEMVPTTDGLGYSEAEAALRAARP